METITKDFENSEWGIIKAANDYLSILEKVKNKNKGLFKKIKIKRLLNNCTFNFNFKIRVLFIVNEYSVFPSVKPVYDEMVYK